MSEPVSASASKKSSRTASKRSLKSSLRRADSGREERPLDKRLKHQYASTPASTASLVRMRNKNYNISRWFTMNMYKLSSSTVVVQ